MGEINYTYSKLWLQVHSQLTQKDQILSLILRWMLKTLPSMLEYYCLKTP